MFIEKTLTVDQLPVRYSLTLATHQPHPWSVYFLTDWWPSAGATGPSLVRHTLVQIAEYCQGNNVD